MSNSTETENTLTKRGLVALRERFPRGWKVRVAREARTRTSAKRAADAVFEVEAPDQRSGRLMVEAKRQIDPRAVEQLRQTFPQDFNPSELLVIAPYIAALTRDRLRDLSMSYLDLTGNIRIVMDRPALFIECQGADSDPHPDDRSIRSLKGDKAGRIVRELIDYRRPPGIRELASRINVSPGYISRVMQFLDRQALIERNPSGSITGVDWPKLLRRWSEDAPLQTRGQATPCLQPRGIASLLMSVETIQGSYALSGSVVAEYVEAVAPVRQVVLYTEDAFDTIRKLKLIETSEGSNVLLIEPSDPWVFQRRQQRDGRSLAALSLAAADLLTSPGRGPAEGAALIEWMTENESTWRLE